MAAPNRPRFNLNYFQLINQLIRDDACTGTVTQCTCYECKVASNTIGQLNADKWLDNYIASEGNRRADSCDGGKSAEKLLTHILPPLGRLNRSLARPHSSSVRQTIYLTLVLLGHTNTQDMTMGHTHALAQYIVRLK